MSENEQSDPRDNAEMNKWKRKIARMEDDYEGALRNLKGFLKGAFGKGITETRLNLAREIKRAEGNTSKVNPEAAGFIATEAGEITGLEEFPWNRDVE